MPMHNTLIILIPNYSEYSGGRHYTRVRGEMCYGRSEENGTLPIFRCL